MMNTFLLNAKPETRTLLRTCATAVAVVGAVFTLTVLVLLAANYIHARVAWPVEAPLLEEMMAEVRAGDADAAAAETVRRLDLVTRRTYFFAEEFAATGFLLFLGGVALTLLALQVRGALTRSLPQPGAPAAEEQDLKAAGRARAVLAGMSIAILLAAGVLYVQLGVLPDFAAVDEGDAPDAMPPEPVLAGTWHGLRGPGGLGVADVTNAPVAWNGETGEGIVWKTALPLQGFSSPVVLDGRVFVTVGTRNQLSVVCLDAATGRLVRQTRIPSALATDAWPEIPDETTYAAPTPAVAGSTVVALFGTGDVAGLDSGGELLWSRHLGVPSSMYGYASSLVSDETRVFIQYDHDEDQRVMALDAATGDTVWERERDVMPSWASPVRIDRDGSGQIVLCANPFLAGYDSATGREVWRAEGMGGEPAPSPAYRDGMVYAATDFSVLMAVDLMFPDETAWQYSRNLPDVSSPLATDERLYMASSLGTLTCFDRFDGTVLWTREFDDGFYSSPILVGDRIYLVDIRGHTFVFKDAGTYEEIAVSPLGEACSSTPAFVPGHILVRGEANLFCIGMP